MPTFRNLALINLALFATAWYFWGFRYNLDITPMWYATFVLTLNLLLAWWIVSRHKMAAYYLIGTAGFIIVLNLILLRGLVTFK